jgi:peptidoglycan hydrolase-like protein with peptidoglycan-binding domain
VNALFLQSGPHPAPLFKAPLAPGEATNTVVVVPRARPADPVPAKAETPAVARTPVEAPKTASASPPPATAAAAHNDAIADLLAPSRRLIALQRALAQYGYGQIKPTGIVDAETRAAIEKFERERKLPVTGQPSDRVAHELTSLTGRPLD